jgi:hypothetical protein
MLRYNVNQISFIKGFTMMEKIHEIIEQLGLHTNMTLDEIPNIDLYMDQVIQLFENKFGDSKRNDEEKVLTKTMINNYAKGKLIFPIKNKKYSKGHLLLMSLIYQLKGALSINDIQVTLDGINKRITNEDIELDSFYNSYLTLSHKNAAEFNMDIEDRIKDIKEEVTKMEDKHAPYLEQVLMISSLVHMSNLYRKVAEKLVDEIVIEKEAKRHR